jgi:nitroimidazol reductase NimA-like FMN-containing flavoprotein (pyridoxamine 5'-phosphate oxidase superfamily)
MVSGAMTVEERAAFLAEVRVGVLAVDRPGRGPLALPIWYVVEDGLVKVSIARSSLKGRLLAEVERASLTVQDEAPPYRYAAVEGPVTLSDELLDVEALAARYLGAELGTWYAQENPHTDDTVTAVLTPETWNTFDFGKVLAG